MLGGCFASVRHRTTRFAALAVSAAVLATTVPLFANSPSDEAPPTLPKLPGALLPLRPTRFDLLERSLEDLLNDGFAIVGFTALAVGPGVVLQQGGRRWVFCALLLSTQPGRPTTAASKCWALN